MGENDRVTTLQTEKIPTFPWLFQTKLRAICRINAVAHLLTQILHEHHEWKLNYSTNKVQVKLFSWAATIKFPWLPKFSDLSLTLGLFPDLAKFPDISRFPEVPEKWQPSTWTLLTSSPTLYNHNDIEQHIVYISILLQQMRNTDNRIHLHILLHRRVQRKPR